MNNASSSGAWQNDRIYPAGDDLFFKRLAIADADSMHEMEKECFSMPWTLAQCKDALTQKAFAAFGLWQELRLIAYISFYHVATELEILNLAVKTDKRRKGYGGRLLGLALQAARKMGMQKAVLEVREGNRAAIALYEKSGFKQCGIRPGYYSDNGENALLYSCVL